MKSGLDEGLNGHRGVLGKQLADSLLRIGQLIAQSHERLDGFVSVLVAGNEYAAVFCCRIDAQFAHLVAKVHDDALGSFCPDTLDVLQLSVVTAAHHGDKFVG